MILEKAFKKFDLSGKTALITGGGTGLGFAMARGLLQSGANVLIAARREDVLRNATEELEQEANGNSVYYRTLDMADRNSVASLTTYANEVLGGVGIFVGNAAQEKMQPLDQLTDDTMDSLYQVNVAANFALCRDLAPSMKSRRWGRVIFISSVASIRGSAQEGASMYAATKAALNGYMRVAAAELGHFGITVNSINPGAYLTEMFQDSLSAMEPNLANTVISEFSDNTALGRMGNTEELEGIIQLLASEAGSYITSAEISVDGGLSMMVKPNTSP